MASVVLTFDDVGLGIQLQEALEAAGHEVAWNAAYAAGPRRAGAAADVMPDVLILSGQAPETLGDAVRAWRAVEPPPALLVVGDTAAARDAAASARTAFVPSAARPTDIQAAAQRALSTRFAGELSLRFARAALGLPASGDDAGDARRLIPLARGADAQLVREALRWHVHDYLAATERVMDLREHRVLTIPEVDLLRACDGTRTVNTIVNAGVLEPAHAARLIWALASVGAATLTPEPPDLTTADRRRVHSARYHLRARRRRLERATLYDVLEVPLDASPEAIDHACRMLALRYHPKRLGALDLGELTPLAATLWQQVRKARTVLLSWADRGRYADWVAAHRHELNTAWAAEAIDSARAEAAFAGGQRALVDGDAFKAVSAMALAARAHPDHPDYEASLAWARYRAELARGNDGRAAARREREIAAGALAGRRPWPRALVALALLCAADRDPGAARWHLHEALACDPELPAAKQLLRRLGSR